jgi:hypothetical protein
MRYVLAPACLAALTLVSSLDAQAGESAVAKGVRKGYASVRRDFLRSNYWPEPFNYTDRDAVRAPFAIMVHNGWQMQNTFGDYHFRPGSCELTEAAELKLKWVMTEAPMQQRTVYVERGETSAMTADRIKAVQVAAERLTVDGNIPPVLETSVQSRGWPADQIDATTRQWLNSVPAPRLPSANGGGGSSTSN